MIDTRGNLQRRQDAAYEERRLEAIKASDDAEMSLVRAIGGGGSPENVARCVRDLIDARVEAILRDWRVPTPKV